LSEKNNDNGENSLERHDNSLKPILKDMDPFPQEEIGWYWENISFTFSPNKSILFVWG